MIETWGEGGEIFVSAQGLYGHVFFYDFTFPSPKSDMTIYDMTPLKFPGQWSFTPLLRLSLVMNG